MVTNRTRKSVLVIYTGGTIGSVHPDNDPLKPLRPASWSEISAFIPGLKNFPIDVTHISIRKPVDSAEMTPENWIELAELIQANYASHDGFVILHGTDTMTYTAAALSFMLKNLGKPVILTGSQLSLGEFRNDALQNLITAIMIAGSKDGEVDIRVVPEVCIFFREKLLRGNRAKKQSAKAYGGFESPNFPLLGAVGEHIEIFEKNVRGQPDASQGFYTETRLNPNVVAFTIFPGTSIDMLRSTIEIPNLRGLVLNTYGAGNGPTSGAFLEVIRTAIDSHRIVVVNVTQCPEGMVEMGLYETSAKLLDQGVVSGLDMSTEAALCKLSLLLGETDVDPERVAEQMQIELCGEQSMSIHAINFGSGGTTDCRCDSDPRQPPGGLTRDNLHQAIVRLFEAEPRDPSTAGDHLQVKVFINKRGASRSTSEAIPQFGGSKTGAFVGGKISHLFDVTSCARTVLDPSKPVNVSLVSNLDFTFKKLSLLLYSESSA